MHAHRVMIADLNATIVARAPNVSITARAAKSNPPKPA
jgi:hypothetical protein